MKAAWRDVHNSLRARGFEKVAGLAVDTFAGTLSVGRINVDVELRISDYDFVQLPEIRLRDIESLPRPIQGHLSDGNALCYAVRETILLDRFQPARSILLVLDQAEKTLEILLHGNPTPEIMAELPAYWGGAPYTFIDDPRSLDAACVGLAKWSENRSILIGAESKQRLQTWCKKVGAVLDADSQVPVFQAISAITPPSSSTKTLAGAVKWMNEQEGITYDLASFRSTDSMRVPGAIMVGANGIFGFTAVRPGLIKQAQKGGGFRADQINLLWSRNADTIEVTKFTGELGDHGEVVSRNLNDDAPLVGKKIVVIGCGTLGGHLIRGLVQMGAGRGGKLLLIDPDFLTPGNIGRHSLSYRELYRNKATALVEQLSAEFPDAVLEAIEKGAQHIWERFAGFDLVIDVTGDEQFSNALNAFTLNRRRSERPLPPILYGMIFGNGIAAHSFLAEGREATACYRCLKPDFGRPWRHGPSEKVLARTEMVARPCGSATFIPFAVSATYSAVGLIMSHVVDVIANRTGANLRMLAIDRQNGGTSGDKAVHPHERCPACSDATV